MDAAVEDRHLGLAHPLAVDDPRHVGARGPDEPAPRLEQHARAGGRGVARESLRRSTRAARRARPGRAAARRRGTGSRARHRHRPGGAGSRPRPRRAAASSTVASTCAARTSASSRFDAPNAWTPHGSSHGEATASAAAARRSASSMPNLPAPASPMIRTRSASASAAADSRRRTGWTRPAASAIAASRRSSPRDSTVTTRIPASTAAASSSSRFPGPVRTMRPRVEAGAQDVPQLAARRDVRPEPLAAQVLEDGEQRVGLDGEREVERRRQRRAQRLDARRHRVQVVDEERRAEPARERLRVDAGHATGGDERGRASRRASSERILQHEPGVGPGIPILHEQRDRHRQAVRPGEVAVERSRARARRPPRAGRRAARRASR